MKKSTLLKFILLIVSGLLAVGCVKKDLYDYYLGPNSTTYKNQKVSYTPAAKNRYPVNILEVSYTIFDVSWNYIESGELEYYPDGDYYAGEWAKVQRIEGESGDTVFVYFEKNETDYLRQIDVNMHPFPYAGGIRVTQLPIGVDELPER